MNDLRIIAVLQRILDLHSDKLANNFTVVTEGTVRIIESEKKS
jgi:hypothetical protein